MKKILLYTDTPQSGGAELQMFLLAKFLDKNEFTPILACSGSPVLDRWCENFQKENLKVIRLKVQNKHDPRHFFELRKIIKHEKVDILHLHLWNPASCRYGFLAVNSLKTPIVITEHDPFKLSRLKDLYKKHSLRKVKKIIAISENNKKLLCELYPQFKSKIQTIYNGIDITWWHSQFLGYKESDNLHTKEDVFQAKKNTLIITTIAELHERKGLKYLIQAIPEVIKNFTNVKFVIIGDGKERKALQSLSEKLKITDHLIFLGRKKEIPNLLESSDIFVLPSRREGFGFVNCEAMIAGLPVIASQVGGIPEIVKDGETGILVPPDDSKPLAEAIIKLISNSDLRTKLGVAGKKRIVENFAASKMAERYGKIYSEIDSSR